MSNYVYLNLEEITEAPLTLEAVNRGDNNIYTRINPNDYSMSPNEKIGYLILPHSNTLTDDQIDRKIKNEASNYNLGYFANSIKNNTDSTKPATFDDIKMSNNDYTWENTRFDLHWRQYHGDTTISGSYEAGIYSLPHNVQPEEITISGNIVENEDKIKYRVTWDAINNEDSADYLGIPDDGPYRFKAMINWRGVNASGFEDGYVYYDEGTMDNGVIFELPLYVYNNASYNFYISNVVAIGDKDACTPRVIEVNHRELINTEGNFYKDLDKIASDSTNKDNLEKVDEILIERNIIDRNRLSVQINDIAINSNKYSKSGLYISKPYVLDSNIYTFSLKVDEYIPKYDEVEKYDAIKYYVEFNSNEWLRISPINRNIEKSNSISVPKMFIFDEFEDTETIKSLKYDSNINEFRIKIAFDVQEVTGDNFPPPEVYDYNCIIFDKKQLLKA